MMGSLQPHVLPMSAEVTLKARRSRQSGEWSTDFLGCPASCKSPGSARQRQKERLYWRAVARMRQHISEVTNPWFLNVPHLHITDLQLTRLDAFCRFWFFSIRNTSRTAAGVARILWPEQEGFACRFGT